MAFETESQQRTIQRWIRLAIQLNGAAESGRFAHITPAAVASALERDAVFEFLSAELPASVWDISKLTDVDRHQLSKQWKILASVFDPAQFHVERSGLALLVAYVLHLIDNLHAPIPA